MLIHVLESAEVDIRKKLVWFCADSASVNLGRIGGVAALLKSRDDSPCPWLVVIHCVSHRLELAMKSAFESFAAKDVLDMLLNIHLIYEHSNKRLRELRAIAEIIMIMDETVLKPQKANGTRWIQHKYRSIKALIHVITL